MKSVLQRNVNYFVHVKKLLNILAWNPEKTGNNRNSEKILELNFLQKVRHIKEVSSNANFSFQLEAIMELNTNKATSGDIHVLLTSRTKSTILSEEFFDKLRIADVTFSYYKNIS